MVTEGLPTRRLILVVEYDGTRYHGFQIQARVLTIQGEIEQALWRLTGERIRIVGASRTDAGVHARGQVVGFRTRSALSPETFIKGLNYYLPPDIAVRASFKVGNNFNLRREVISREYRYLILNSSTPSPLERKRAYLVTTLLNVGAMNKACQVLIGKHDFASFTWGGNRGSTVRTLYKAEIYKEGELVILDMKADSFLPQQVRRTVGALIKVGAGKTDAEAFWELAASKRPGLVGPTAPPYGLCLMKVDFRNDMARTEGEDLQH